MTASLFPTGENQFQHKIPAIAEEEGAPQRTLKLLQSDGELTIASTGIDASGNPGHSNSATVKARC